MKKKQQKALCRSRRRPDWLGPFPHLDNNEMFPSMANLLTGSAPTNLQVHKLCLLYPSRKWAFFFTFKTEVSLNSLDSTQSLSAEWVSNQNTGRSDSITNLTCRSQEKTKLTSNSSNEVGGRQKNNRCSTQTLREKKKKTATSFIMFQNCLMLAAIN